MLSERHGLLVVNGNSGRGTSQKLADTIRLQTSVESVGFHDFLLLSPTQKRQVLAPFTDVFVLGGDGSTFTMMQLMYQLFGTEQNSSNNQIPPVLTALGMGGENVVAKHMGTHQDKLSAVLRVLAGEHSTVPVFPSWVEKGEELQPFFWNVHAGFSAAVLYRIEELRTLGVGDLVRRYRAVVAEMIQMQSQNPVEYELNGVQQQSVLDFGIITALFPYWTSKVKLSPEGIVPAMLHTIAKPSDVDMSKPVFSARFILEMISLQQGLPMPKKIVAHQAIGVSDRIAVRSQSGIPLAIDSESTDLHQATIKVGTQFDLSNQTNQAAVLLASLASAE